MPIANLMLMAMWENATATGTTTRCSLCFVVCALGVCANERKNVHDKRKTKKKETRLHSWRACVLCLLLLSRPFYDNHSYIHTRKYVCLCAVNHPARYCCCAAPTTAVASVDRQQTSFCVCILECRLIVVVVAAVLLGCLLYFIFFFRFRICHHHHHRTQSIHTHICICGCSCIHTYIPELTGNRQRLYFIISFATLSLSRVSCCLRKGRGPSRIEYA